MTAGYSIRRWASCSPPSSACWSSTSLCASCSAPSRKDSDARYRARKIITFIGYTAGVLLLAAVFSDRLGRLTVAFGVAGAGVAFALQEVIASIAGWAAVNFAAFYRVGDRIQLGGIKGDVIDIGILRTTLMECGQWINADQYNGRIVRVANSFVFKDPVFNYSADFPFLWDEIVVPVRYGSDAQLAREVLTRIVDDVVGEYARSAKQGWKRIVNQYRIEDARIDPMVTLIANDNLDGVHRSLHRGLQAAADDERRALAAYTQGAQ